MDFVKIYLPHTAKLDGASAILGFSIISFTLNNPSEISSGFITPYFGRSFSSTSLIATTEHEFSINVSVKT